MLSNTITAGAATSDVTSRRDSKKINNSLIFLSNTTPPTPPDTTLHSRSAKVVNHAQRTLRVYVLLLVDINYFPQFTRKMGSMSTKKCEKIENLLKNLHFLRNSFAVEGMACLLVKKRQECEIPTEKAELKGLLSLLGYHKSGIGDLL